MGLDLHAGNRIVSRQQQKRVHELLGFVVDVESQFYPQIGTLYERRIEAWAAARREKLALDKAKEGNLEPV
jgi:hypothetical protein